MTEPTTHRSPRQAPLFDLPPDRLPSASPAPAVVTVPLRQSAANACRLEPPASGRFEVGRGRFVLAVLAEALAGGAVLAGAWVVPYGLARLFGHG